MQNERSRAWRRFQAIRAGKQQLRIWKMLGNLPKEEATPHRYFKQSALGCNCSKKSKGRPKVGHGPCGYGAKKHIPVLRRGDRKAVQDRDG